MKKIIHSFKIRSFILIAALSTGLGFISPVFAQEVHSYIVDLNSKRVTDLGSLGGGSTYATAINDAGQVVGNSQTAAGQTHAFITGPNGVGMTDPGAWPNYTRATGINNAGQVVGYFITAEGGHAFITGPNGVGVTNLGSGAAYAINDTGQVVGYSDDSGLRAFITGPNGVGIITLEGNTTEPISVNDAGQVVGYFFTENYRRPNHAFITGPNGAGMIDLGTLGGNYSTAEGINNAGQVVGAASTSDGAEHAFITGPNGINMTDLGTLGGNYIESSAEGINTAGQVVGMSYFHGSDGTVVNHAFVTGPNGVGMTDLNSLVNLPAGLVLTQATAINNHGQIAVIGVIPEPESYALMLAGLALVGFMARSKQKI